jgi:hypothetical protein
VPIGYSTSKTPSHSLRTAQTGREHQSLGPIWDPFALVQVQLHSNSFILVLHHDGCAVCGSGISHMQPQLIPSLADIW